MIIVLIVPPEDVPVLASSLAAVFQAQGQAAVDAALAALSMRPRPSAPPEPPTEGVTE